MQMKKLVSLIAFTAIAFISLPILSTKAILPDSTDYKQAQLAAKSNLRACRNKKDTRVNGECILFYAISTENSEVYKSVDGNWQPAKLQMFDSPIGDGKISAISVVKFDKEWAYGFTSNKTPGRKLFRLRMSTIHYNYGC
jgi:hypothetical protein